MTSGSHLFVIFSCQKHENTRVKWQASTWPQRLPSGVRLLKMTGSGDGKVDKNGILRLCVADGYYDLVDKTQALFDWFLEERQETWLVKCDDDVWLSPRALARIISNQHHYAGAYGIAYAGGPLYVLHRDVIAKLGPLRDYVSGSNLAEDMAVGAAVNAIGIGLGLLKFNQIEWYNHLTDNPTGSHNWDMAFSFGRGNHKFLMEYCETRYKRFEVD